jgi:acetyl-CoA acetyltransferase
MHEYGATREHMGWVSINSRANAQLNPKAMFYGKPMTMEDYLASRMIVEPFCLFDCCLDSDGAVAIIVTSAERARDLKQRPAYILAATQATATEGESMTSHHRPRISRLPESWYAGAELWRVSGVTPKDIDVCQLYDAFSILVPAQLEEYGFVGEGEGGDFCWEGKRIQVDGELPVNTSGGLMSEAYIHGMNLIAEAVRQIRGTSTNQVKDVELSMSTAGLGVPTGALILRR